MALTIGQASVADISALEQLRMDYLKEDFGELTDEQDRKTCWKYLVTSKPSNKLENLPASFGETGRVLIGADGQLMDAE